MTIFLQIIFYFGMSWSGMSGKINLASYTIYSFDSTKVLLISTDTKQKWSLPRNYWFGGQEPTIGKKVRLSQSIQKKLSPYR